MTKTEIATGFHDRRPHLFMQIVRPPELEARFSGHAMTKRLYAPAAYVDFTDPEELYFRERPPVDPFENRVGSRALHLKPEMPASNGAPCRVGWRSIVLVDGYIEAAGLGVVLDPVHQRCAANQHQQALGQIKHDSIADDVAIEAAWRELLRLPWREALRAVRRQAAEQCKGIFPFDERFGHVVRLVGQHRRVTRCDLLVPKVRKLTRDYRENEGR